MTRLFKNWKSLYKGVLFALAFIMCFTFVPVNALTLLAEAVNGEGLKNYNTITLSSDANTIIPKGGSYDVNYATFHQKSGQDYVIGKDNSRDNITSSITVKYKGTNDTEEIATADGNQTDTRYGVFTPKRVGTYVITYTVTTEDGTFEYDHEVTCTLSKASFNFYDLIDIDNDGEYEPNGNMPNVYDLAYLAKLEQTGKAIKIPLPVMKDDKDREFENVKYVVPAEEGPGKDYDENHVSADDDYVLISITGQDQNVKIEKDENGDFVINASGLKEAGDYIITYTFKQKKQVVAFIDKSFKVESRYFFTDSTTDTAKQTSGYTLETEWETSAPTTAETNVRVLLPKIKGHTSAENVPSKEDIPLVIDEIVVQRRGTDKIYADVENQDEYLEVENNNYYFIPKQDGDYRIIYRASDFYGNTTDEKKTYFDIVGVKDTTLPTVYVYNADNDYAQYDDEDFVSAHTRLKSTTAYNDIIIYAIGATDNSNGEIELRRAIYDNNTTLRFETKENNDKNLIIQFTNYNDLLGYNYALRHDIEKTITLETQEDGGTLKYTEETEKQIRDWLVAHNYRIVTNKEDEAKQDAELYVYVNYNHEFKNVYTSDSDKTTSYTVRYEARDQYAKDNNTQRRVSYTIKLANPTYLDEKAPTITGPQNLNGAYLPTDTITFSAPSATDDDDRLEVKVAYRYLTGGKAINRSDEPTAEETLEFTPGEVIVGGLVEKKNTPKPSYGWYFLNQEDNNYSINLQNRPEKADSVQLLIYTVDDYGNVGQMSKTMEIINIVDNDKPTLFSITEGNNAEVLNQGDKINLPTIVYRDDNVSYMTSNVTVYNIGVEDDKEFKHELSVQQSTQSARPAEKQFTVSAGSFVASYAGDYQVIITVRDAGGNSHATYFNYTVKEKIKVEDLKINNIHETTINRRVTEKGNEDGIYRIPSPQLTLPKSTQSLFAGIDVSDDTTTATDYEVIMDGNMYTNQYILQGDRPVDYKLQYVVRLVSYPKDSKYLDVVTVAEDGSKTNPGHLVSFKATGDSGNATLVEKGTNAGEAKEYYIYVPGDNPNELVAFADDGTQYKPKDNKTLQEELGVQGYVLYSEVVTIKYSNSTAPIILNDLSSNIKSQYLETGTKISLPRPDVSLAIGQEIDLEETGVRIEVTKSGSTTEITTYKYNEWVDTTSGYNPETKEIVYTLSQNGLYRITYFAKAKNNDATGELVKEIKNGDTIAPTLTVKEGFLKDGDGNAKKSTEFKLNDVLSLDKDMLDVSDTGGSTEQKDIVVDITVTFAGQPVTNIGEEQGLYRYNLDKAGEYKIEVKATDSVGNYKSPYSVTITIEPKGSTPTITYETIGIILIVISAVILAGVIGYFVYSKIKFDKEEKKKK